MIRQQLALQALRRRMRQGQRPPSRFQAQSVESQMQAGPDLFQAALPDGDGDADSDIAMSSSLAAWDLPDLLALLKQAMHLPTCNAVCNRLHACVLQRLVMTAMAVQFMCTRLLSCRLCSCLLC